MTFDVLAKSIIGALQDRSIKEIDFVWHGGEATLLGIEFYQKALWLQENFNNFGKHISNSIQTNAYQTTTEWIDFLARHKFGVGVSIDGPELIHDSKRITIRGGKTYANVAGNIQAMSQAGIPIGALLVADREIIDLGPDKMLDWLCNIGVKELAILNSLPNNSDLLDSSKEVKYHIPMKIYVDFLRETYVAWSSRGRPISIREFESLENNIEAKKSILCVHNGRCMGQFLTIDPDGTVSACDKYINDPNFIFGNVKEESLIRMTRKSKSLKAQRTHSNIVSENLEGNCKFGHVCRGGCPHDAYVSSHLGGGDSNCCGLAPLIETMVRYTGHGGRPSTEERNGS